MVGSYEECLTGIDTLTIERAFKIYRTIIECLDLDNNDDREILQDYLMATAKYANVRANWNLLSREEKMEADANRTACPNKVILHLNILARYLASKGKDVSWREELGDGSLHRKKIGILLVMLHAWKGCMHDKVPCIGRIIM